MTTIKNKNQVHPPRPKKARVDNQGNDKKRLWLKEGTCTMLLTKDLTEQGCKVLINSINENLKKLGAKALPVNKFLITR
jgi:hypothetical protein